MFNFFKKKEIIIPEFKSMQDYKHREKFIGRNKKWTKLNEEDIMVFEKRGEQIHTHTLDYWFQRIFLKSDGKSTPETMLADFANEFKEHGNKIPNDLDEMVIEYVDSLLNELNFIDVSEQPFELDKDVQDPIEK